MKNANQHSAPAHERPRYLDTMQVTARSKFGDSTWNFYEETGRSRCILHWAWRLNDQTGFDAPALAQFSQALKQLAYILVKGLSPRSPRISPRSVIHEIESTRSVVRFLFEKREKHSFDEVSPEDYRQFVVHELRAHRTPHRIARALKSLARLAREGEFIDPAIRLEVAPSNELLQIGGSRGRNRALKERRTRIIPDIVLKRAWEISVDYLLNCSNYLLAIRDQELKFRKQFDSGELSQWEFEKKWRLHSWNSNEALYRQSGFAKFVARLDPPKDSKVLAGGIRNAKHHLAAMIDLRRAAIFVLGITSGIRLSTFSTLERNCLKTGTGRNGQKLVWLKGKIFKTADDPLGLPAEWVCGEYGALAVNVLQRWGGARYDQKRLLVALRPQILDGVIIGDDSGASAEEAVADVAGLFHDHHITDENGNVWRFAAHQMRATFVRLVCLNANTPLDVLQGYLGHLSQYMTDYYLGNDPALWLEYYESVYEHSRQKIADALSEPYLAGAGGEKIAAEIDRAIQRGDLPNNFRGHAGEAIRFKVAEDFIRSGQHIHFLDTNFCRFRPSLAVCNPGGKGPLAHLCHPLACKNATISSIHAPVWAALSQSISSAAKKYARSVILRPPLKKQAAIADQVLARIHRNTLRHEKKKQMEAAAQSVEVS